RAAGIDTGNRGQIGRGAEHHDAGGDVVQPFLLRIADARAHVQIPIDVGGGIERERLRHAEHARRPRLRTAGARPIEVGFEANEQPRDLQLTPAVPPTWPPEKLIFTLSNRLVTTLNGSWWPQSPPPLTPK